MLAFDPARPLGGLRGAFTFDERFVFEVRFEHADNENELWSTGPCGEDPIHLAEDIELAGTFSLEGKLAICDAQTFDVLVLDPTGAVPPWPLFETNECDLSETPYGVVTTLGSNEDQLVLQPWPSDWSTMERAEQIVLLDGVRSGTPRVTDTEVFAVATSGELVVVGLDDFAVEGLAENVDDFLKHGRWVLWQSLDANDEPLLYVLDR